MVLADSLNSFASLVSQSDWMLNCIASESDCKLTHFAMHLNLMVFILQVLSDTMQGKGLSFC